MIDPMRYLALCALLFYAAISGAAEQADVSRVQANIRIEIKDSLLALKTLDAPLHEVVREIGKLAGFKTILVEDFIEPPLINVTFDNIPVREAVEQLVSEENRIIFYAPTRNGAEQHVISQVWLLGSSGTTGDIEDSDDETIAFAKEKVVKDHKLVKLTKMLQQDQAVQVRIRAAIALGALQNERAVLALESALLDEHASVRSQAINALGRIGGEQAITALGNILLYGSADKSERVMAAQALWKHDSEVARDYLLAGTYDTDEQVRLASSSPKSSVSNRPTKGIRPGPEETQ